MQQTTNYNLLIPEGTDVVNPLTQVNPNFQTIDGAMFANKQATIGTASEVVTGTVHAIIRNNTDSDVFRFTATGAWTSGDTMTLDGQSVTVHLSDGTTPATNSYIIGAEVLAMVNGSLVTLAISTTPPAQGVTSFNTRTGAVVPAASDYDGSMIDYDNTTSGLNSTDVQGAIDEIEDQIQNLPSGGSDDYSLTEHVVGTWLDGVTPVYEKTINFGALPNSTTKTVNHDITNLDHFVSCLGFAWRPDKLGFELPISNPTDLGGSTYIYCNATGINVNTVKDFSSYSNCYFTLRYTKTV